MIGYLAHNSQEIDEVNQLEKLLNQHKIETINPFRKQGFITEYIEDNSIVINKYVVQIDRKDISNSDFILLYFPTKAQTIGVICEMMLAYSGRQYIISCVPKQHMMHPWMQYYSDAIFFKNNSKDIIFYIKSLKIYPRKWFWKTS